MNKTYIREIFLSIQGEGPHVGEQHLFIRFCGCNLHCAYCDTDFDINESREYTPVSLLDKVNSYGEKLTVSLTGGEPLVSVKFLKEFLPLVKKFGHTIYLETNAALPEQLDEIVDYTDIISADIKLASAAGEQIPHETIDKFFKIASQKELFAKVVFNEKITEDEIRRSAALAGEHNCEIILQPEMNGNKFTVSAEFCERIFNEFREQYAKVRLIPQIHKFLDIR